MCGLDVESSEAWLPMGSWQSNPLSCGARDRPFARGCATPDIRECQPGTMSQEYPDGLLDGAEGIELPVLPAVPVLRSEAVGGPGCQAACFCGENACKLGLVAHS